MPTSRLTHRLPTALPPSLLLPMLAMLAALSSGCAAPGPGEKQAADEEAVYITGSHMARRGKSEPVTTMSKAQLEEIQRLNDMPGTK